MLFSVANIPTARVKCVAFHPQKPWAFLSCHDGSVSIWDYVVGALVYRFQAHASPVRAIDVHPTQPLFVTGGDDGVVKLWSLDRALVYTFTGHTDYVRSVFFHPGHHPYLVSSSDDGTARIWNWQSRQRVADLIGHRDIVMCARWHPTEELVATASLDGTLRVWDVSPINSRGAVGKVQQLAMQVLALPHMVLTEAAVGAGHSSGLNWVSWALDERNVLLTASDDHKCKIWRLARGTPRPGALLDNTASLFCTATLSGHMNHVSTVEQSTKNMIVSASIDGKMRVYEAKNHVFVGEIGVRDLDPLAELASGCSSYRWWCLREHPTSILWAAGHDSGLCLFAMQPEAPVGAYDPHTHRCYVVEKNRLSFVPVTEEGDKATVGKARPITQLFKHTVSAGGFGAGKILAPPKELLILGDPYPFVVTYHDGGAMFFVPYCDPKDASLKSPREVIPTMCSPIRVDSTRIAWLERVKDGVFLVISVLSTDKNSPRTRHPVSVTAQHLVAGGQAGRIYLTEDSRIVSLDVFSKLSDGAPLTAVVETASTSHTTSGLPSKDGLLLALRDEHSIFIYDDKLSLVASITSRAPITSMCWGMMGRGLEETEGRKAHTLLYATKTHLCYLIPGSNTGALHGTISSVNEPLYLMAGFRQCLCYMDTSDDVQILEFDSRVVGLMQAVAQGNEEDCVTMLRRLRGVDVGLALASRLLETGHPDVAFHTVPHSLPEVREYLSVSMGHLDRLDLNVSRSPDEWIQLSILAIGLGQGILAADFLKKAKRADLLAFLHSVHNAPLEELPDDVGDDPNQLLNAALLTGNPEVIRDVLLRFGLTTPARILADAHGLSFPNITQGTQPTMKISVGKALKPIKRTGSLRNYTITHVENALDELLSHDVPIDEPHTTEAEIKSAGVWDESESDPVEESVAPPTESQRQETQSTVASKKGHLFHRSSDEVFEFLTRFGIRSKNARKLLEPRVKEAIESSQDESQGPCSSVRFTDVIQAFEDSIDVLTAGEFDQAREKMSSLLRDAIFCRATSQDLGEEEREELCQTIKMLVTYVAALQCDGARQTVDSGDRGRAAELAILFATRRLRPLHIALAIKKVMAKVRRLGARSHAVALAERYLDLVELPDLRENSNLTSGIAKAKSLRDEKADVSDELLLSFSFEEHDRLEMCSMTFVPIKGAAIYCTACGAPATKACMSSECPVCHLGIFEA
ncbi:Coatomer alpha subunit [Giardia muris]|uniref:Coatomer alpha subunit n=1 Tax=Giardia muris TaxID=5742 RepID=A0A4Z1SUL6_GIAMU|nr:Coatomer alpha subunit [Giardia muris]|eukprot:TNJ29592.1 Coatomer alpha subunit [Giardia muris]